MDEYRREFVEEGDEAITELNTQLLELEQSPDDSAVIDDIFRTAHTLKGNAGAMGLDRISDLAHVLEDVLDEIKAGSVPVSPSLMDTIFDAVDALESMIDEVATDGRIETDPSPVISSLRTHLPDGTAEFSPPSDEEIDEILTRANDPTDTDHDVFLVRLSITPSGELNNGLVVVEALIDAFDLLGTVPSKQAIEKDEHGDRIDAVFSSAVGESSIEAALQPVEAVAAFHIVSVGDRFDVTEPVEPSESVEDDLTTVDLSSEEANEMSVDELLDEFTELDDIDALADEIEDASEFDDIADAGSFDELFDEPTEADAEPAESDGEASEPDTSASDDDVDDASAVFAELQNEVEMVGFDELQEELDELEFDEFDEDEIGMDELLGDDVDVDDPAFLDIEADSPIDEADLSPEKAEPTVADADSPPTEATDDEVSLDVEGDSLGSDVEPDPSAAVEPDSEPISASDESDESDPDGWEPEFDSVEADSVDAEAPSDPSDESALPADEAAASDAGDSEPEWVVSARSGRTTDDTANASADDPADDTSDSSDEPVQDVASAGEAAPSEFADALFGSEAEPDDPSGEEGDDPDRTDEPSESPAVSDDDGDQSTEVDDIEIEFDEESDDPASPVEPVDDIADELDDTERAVERDDAVARSEVDETEPPATVDLDEQQPVSSGVAETESPDAPETETDHDLDDEWTEMDDDGVFEADVFDPEFVPEPDEFADESFDSGVTDDESFDAGVTDDESFDTDVADEGFLDAGVTDDESFDEDDFAALDDVAFDPSDDDDLDGEVIDPDPTSEAWDVAFDDTDDGFGGEQTAGSADFEDDDRFAVDEFDDPSVDESFVEFDEETSSFGADERDGDEADSSETGDPVLDNVAEMVVPDLNVPDPAEFETESEIETGSQSIRVDRESVDSLLQLVEGLVTSRVRLRSAVTDQDPYETLERELDDLEDITSELQETVMDVRLVPLKTVTNRLPRVVRDLAREQDKQISFERENDDVELDRSILDRIGDPLIHLVRNAVDHGIEPTDSREEAGKPPEGTITLRADRSRDRVTIEVTDDGSGLEADRIRDEALEAGVLDEDEVDELDDGSIYDLVFHPGLSTADEVTDVSGRGVGMDVVRRTIETLNGTVSVESEPGEGTTVTMTLPVSVAIDDVLFVETAGEQFGIPVDVVQDVADGRFVAESDDGLVLDDGGEPMPVVELAEAMETSMPSADRDGMVVRVRDDVRSVALQCDLVHGRREVVVKPFDGFMRDVPGVSGATVRGRGEVVTILDVATI
ncbi:ATP-binding protein [Halovivax gelatinilyticus]|uniref:ATP-binding protein n=1 Tax=Halovivax gelatinilyticus TaxID=2961597 RepID=UPI0020CA7E40|nr:ATP-binding protein [Halovivax gelatinilyticus]